MFSGVFGSVLGIQRTVLLNMDYKPLLPVISSINKVKVQVYNVLTYSVVKAQTHGATLRAILLAI